MRKLFAFVVWLFSFWTWKDFFLRWLRWLWSLASHLGSGETVEHLPSQEGQEESNLARFLSSLPEDGRRCKFLGFGGSLEVRIRCGRGGLFTLVHGTGVEAGYHEFLQAVSSSDIAFCEDVTIQLDGDNSCEDVEAFVDALCKSGNRFKKLHFNFGYGSAIRFAKCVSSVIIKNDAIQHLSLSFGSLKEDMDKELVVEFMGIIVVPYNLRILKSFRFSSYLKLTGEGMEQLMKPFQSPLSVLEDLWFSSLTSDVQLEHISDMLALSTSLKSLLVYTYSTGLQKTFERGFSSIATALCLNQSLKSLWCKISSSMEVKVLLDPLMSRNNNLQRNTTLIKLHFCQSLGGKVGIETLVDLIHTNTSLSKLHFYEVDDLSLHGTQGVENVLDLLEALKKNKSLKKIGFFGSKAVGGYKVLGALMDLLLENHNIQDIDLRCTGLEKSGDAHYVSSALSKKKKMKLWDIVQSMAIVNPTFGRVFLCGQPFAWEDKIANVDEETKGISRKR